MPLYKMCGSCGRKVESGIRCPCQRRDYKIYDTVSRDKEAKKFYNSSLWLKTKDYVLSIDEMDVYLYMTKGEIVLANTVHHIVPRRDAPQRALDITNLMSLHHDTHSMIEQLYKKDKKKMIKELTTMLEEFRQGRGIEKSFW